MIVSDLEGNYLDAFQFTDGKQQRVALAKASGMEETDIDENDVVSTFTLMDANSAGMYSRSGGEGGGWQEVPPDIPEVAVTYCKRCGVPIEECPGHCPICNLPLTRCPGHYTPPPTQWYCPYCHSPYCPGNCYTGGDGGSSTPSTVSPQGNLSKDVFSSNSRLTPEQWKSVENVLDKINNDCMGGRMVKALKGSNIQIIFDSSLKSLGRYENDKKELRVKSFSNVDGLQMAILHELFHSQQIHNSNGKLNLEIEAQLITYRYALRNRVTMPSSDVTRAIAGLSDELDAHYNYSESNFDKLYDDIVKEMRKSDIYKNVTNYPESSSARNFSIAQKLSVDCM